LYFRQLKNNWRGVRVVEGARLESVYTSKGYRGFESRPLRQLKNPVTSGIFISSDRQKACFQIGNGNKKRQPMVWLTFLNSSNSFFEITPGATNFNFSSSPTSQGLEYLFRLC
jgi:hypothetical protein